MANEQQRQPDNGSRMDRFERGLEHLLKAQATHEARAAARFEELERARQEFGSDLSQLLKAQVLLTDSQRSLIEAQRQTDERLDALIQVVDPIIRKRPPEAPLQ